MDNNNLPQNTHKLTFLQSLLLKIYPFQPYSLLIIEDILLAFIIIALNIANGIIVHSYLLQKLTLVNSIYFSITTITTIGYGDIKPTTFSSRLYIICYASIGVLSTAKAIFLLNNARAKYLQSKLYFKELDTELVNHHEVYNKHEFVLYKLIKMKVITVEMKEQIEELFNVMDMNKSGMLLCHDILKYQDLINHNNNRNFSEDYEDGEWEDTEKRKKEETNMNNSLLSSIGKSTTEVEE